MITELEREVLERIGEDETLPDNFTGEDEVRDAVVDALDEYCMLTRSLRKTLLIPLRGEVNVYVMGAEDTVIGVLGARLKGQKRRLEHVGLETLKRDDPLWLRTRGSPWRYSVLDFTKLLIYPCYGEDVEILEVDVIYVPDAYTEGEFVPEVRGAFQGLIVEGALAFLYLLVPNKLKYAVELYSNFLKRVGGKSEFNGSWVSYMNRIFRETTGK